MTSGWLRVGVDLGGTKTEAIALNPSGATLLRRRIRILEAGWREI